MHRDRQDENTDLVRLASQGDEAALGTLLSQYRPRLKNMVRLRLDNRLRGRIDESDVIQEAHLEISKRLGEYFEARPLPFYLWLRHITLQKLVDAHRRHLGSRMRDAGRDVSLHRGGAPPANTTTLAAQLLGRLTSPSQKVLKQELRLRVQQALDDLSETDREVLVLRHFEQLTNAETAEVLEITTSGASSRYLRALRRLRVVLTGDSDCLET